MRCCSGLFPVLRDSYDEGSKMNYETGFSVVGIIAFVGWGALAFAPLYHLVLTRFAFAVSIVLALAYALFMLLSFGQEPAVDFGSLAGVINGFSVPGHMLTGWTHFLAFDLMIGVWETRQSKKWNVPHLLLLPCLALTFLFGPLGILSFLMIGFICKQRAGTEQSAMG